MPGGIRTAPATTPPPPPPPFPLLRESSPSEGYHRSARARPLPAREKGAGPASSTGPAWKRSKRERLAYLYAAIASRNPCIAPSSARSSRQNEIRKNPGDPNPVPGVTSTFHCSSSFTKATSSGFGDAGKA